MKFIRASLYVYIYTYTYVYKDRLSLLNNEKTLFLYNNNYYNYNEKRDNGDDDNDEIHWTRNLCLLLPYFRVSYLRELVQLFDTSFVIFVLVQGNIFTKYIHRFSILIKKQKNCLKTNFCIIKKQW